MEAFLAEQIFCLLLVTISMNFACLGLKNVEFIPAITTYLLFIHLVMIPVLTILGQGFNLRSENFNFCYFVKNSEKTQCGSDGVWERYRTISKNVSIY